MKKKLLTVMLSVCLSLSSCTFYNQETGTSIQDESILTSETVSETSTSSTQTTTSIVETSPTTSTTTDIQTESIQTESTVVVPESSLSIIEILPFDGTPCYAVNNNQPYFTNDEITNQSYEYYSDLDSLGRCGVCIACISLDMMPTTEREGIGMVKPSGWHLDKYDFVDGKYLFNRCHLIGYQLTGENANLSNLITGTRYMNIQGMLPFENQTADYIKSTGNHVMYRVTPIFEGDNLVATGVLMEAYSVEDSGQGICFNIFCYNAQPGVVIDYATGDNHLDENSDAVILDPYVEDEDTPLNVDRTIPDSEDNQSQTYILNKNTKKIHYPWCSSVEDMAEHNKQEFTGDINEMIEKGYTPCKRCNPI